MATKRKRRVVTELEDDEIMENLEEDDRQVEEDDVREFERLVEVDETVCICRFSKKVHTYVGIKYTLAETWACKCRETKHPRKIWYYFRSDGSGSRLSSKWVCLFHC